MARWLCDVCDRTNSEGQTLCWCCGKERRAETVEDLRTALTAATERAERAEADLTAARALLREAVEVWSRCVARDFPAPEDAEVRALGERIGFGALMDAAEKEWRASLVADYPPCVGGEFVHGPCRATVDDLSARIEAHIGRDK